MLAPTLALVALSASTLASPLQLPFLSPSSSPTSALVNSTSKPVHVALGVMSRCPDASLCETVWDRVLEERLPTKFGSGVVADLVDMELVFIAHEDSSAPYGATCMHGELECKGNVQQLCAARHWRAGSEGRKKKGVDGEAEATLAREKRAWEDSWNFVQCMNYGETSRIGSDAAAKRCASVVGREWTDTLASCVEGKEGRRLLVDSLERAERLAVKSSCTILIEDKPICIHDGSWKQCPGGHDVRDFAREVRDTFERLNSERGVGADDE
ncbi:hypothetical protein JCM3775_003210 [Rhodotorula graminis]|uniref:Uncharacterized protein n=1 Tax=Rhodotorula graminis (strain WP1) TaxID=578459 RepID=A0A194S993_RHOGW|nr:uncharacterized protein RHOBADRAFT_52101 [Rhodotorula graminis WP1]KPV77154.1 hypothetical protein RHOBADRAFT_52101 [Rhodotorula graminis WP1]